ncbi:ATP-binding protein [Pseudoduganella sp. RAF19]|uniref:ATP-binding protein n=1 Tax=Pseudoduganella sp. RAF19 TaxID=3233052 RepID=UPI003F97466F
MIDTEDILQASLEQPPLLAPPPRTVRDTGLELQMLAELATKSLYQIGKTHLPVLTTRLRLSINVLREVMDFLVAEQLAEVAWRGESDIDVKYQLTGRGRECAADWLERRPYAGPAPVPLDAYRSLVMRQAAALPDVSAEEVAAVFADDYLDTRVHELAGAAMYSARSLLLYGVPGSGKSTLARKLGRLLQGTVALPYAIAVGQEIIQVFDATIHQPPPIMPGRTPPQRSADLRWILCQRPIVHLGAELSADMLELRYDAHSGCYQAPPHFKANNGLFILDDLGRQRVPASALLNRFIQPLDVGMDQLALQGGFKFTVPFRAMLVCATNFEPATLLDAASLRRIGYKVRVPALSEANYRALCRQQCRALNVELDEAALNYLMNELHAGSAQPLLASLPREIVSRVADFAGFAGQAPRLSAATLDQAWSSIFAGCAPARSEVPALYESIA